MITPSFSLTATERVLPKLALDFTTASLDSRVTFTRTTSATNPATYVASNGYITLASNNAARFDFDPVTLVCKGLLIEEARTNLVKYSQDFSNASWTLGNATIGSSTTSPDGTANGQSLMETSATGAHRFFVTSSITATNGTTYTYSVFAKANGRDFVRLSDGNVANVTCFFNLSTGAVGTVGASITASSITAYKDGWYRCSISYVMVGTAAAPAFVMSPDGSTVSYAGDITKGVYVWGAQLEAGAFSTSYIPTTTTALTRNADVATMTGTNFSDWFNASEGAVFVEASINFTPLGAGAPELYSINSGSSANIFATFFANATGFLNTNIRSGSASQGILASASAATVGAIFRHCATYKVDSFASSFNAATPATDNLGSVPVGPNILVLGDSSINGVGNRSRYFRKFFYYPQRLTNAELQAFSK